MNRNKLRNSHLPLKLHAFLLLIAATPPPLPAQPSLPANPLATGLAGSVCARDGGGWLARSNPAAIGIDGRGMLTACFSPSAIGMDGYGEGTIVASLPLDPESAIGAAASGVTARAYREGEASAIGALTVAGMIRLGAALTLHSIAIDGYGSASSPTLDLGAIAMLGERTRFGVSLGNVARGRLAGGDLPSRVAFGFAFDLNGGVILSADAWQESRRPAGGAIALSCAPIPGLSLRGGIGTGPGTIALGIGYDAGAVTIEYGGAYIAPLGLRHVMGAGIAF